MNPIQIVLIVGMFVLMFVIENSIEKFVDYSYDENPWLMMIFLIGAFLFFVWILIDFFVKKFSECKKNSKKMNEFKKALIQDFKVLGISLLIGFLTIGFIVLILIAKEM